MTIVYVCEGGSGETIDIFSLALVRLNLGPIKYLVGSEMKLNPEEWVYTFIEIFLLV